MSADVQQRLNEFVDEFDRVVFEEDTLEDVDVVTAICLLERYVALRRAMKEVQYRNN